MERATGLGSLLFDTYCSGVWGQTAPSGGQAPRRSAKRGGLVVAVAVAFACAARSARRGERKPMRWAGAPRALSPTRSLAAGVVGGTCPFSARSFCAGVKVCRALRLRAGLAVRLALLGEAARPCQLHRLGPRRPPSALARLLTGTPRVSDAPWAQNTKNKTRAKRASVPSCGAKRGQRPR